MAKTKNNGTLTTSSFKPSRESQRKGKAKIAAGSILTALSSLVLGGAIVLGAVKGVQTLKNNKQTSAEVKEASAAANASAYVQEIDGDSVAFSAAESEEFNVGGYNVSFGRGAPSVQDPSASQQQEEKETTGSAVKGSNAETEEVAESNNTGNGISEIKEVAGSSLSKEEITLLGVLPASVIALVAGALLLRSGVKDEDYNKLLNALTRLSGGEVGGPDYAKKIFTHQRNYFNEKTDAKKLNEIKKIVELLAEQRTKDVKGLKKGQDIDDYRKRKAIDDIIEVAKRYPEFSKELKDAFKGIKDYEISERLTLDNKNKKKAAKLAESAVRELNTASNPLNATLKRFPKNLVLTAQLLEENGVNNEIVTAVTERRFTENAISKTHIDEIDSMFPYALDQIQSCTITLRTKNGQKRTLQCAFDNEIGYEFLRDELVEFAYDEMTKEGSVITSLTIQENVENVRTKKSKTLGEVKQYDKYNVDELVTFRQSSREHLNELEKYSQRLRDSSKQNNQNNETRNNTQNNGRDQ